MAKVRAQSDIVWLHVSSEENPADLASHKGSVSGSMLWWNGPKWLAYRQEWPPNPMTSTSLATKVEAKAVREVLSVKWPKGSGDRLEDLLGKHELLRPESCLGYQILN